MQPYKEFEPFPWRNLMKVTESAQIKIAYLIKDSQIATPDKEQFLRVAVQPGGCSGLKYQTYFDYEEKDGDEIYPYEGFNLRVDRMSVPYLENSTMGYADTMEKQGFTIDNPDTHGSCACGDSFN